MSLSAENIGLERDGRWLVHGLGFHLTPGTGLLVQGSNGCGKTTLLRTLCGLRPPRAGTVRWHGNPLPAAAATLRANLAWLGHADAVRAELSAQENLEATLALAGESVTREQVRAALEAAGLGPHRHLPGRQLSQGLRRRAALARFFATRRSLWVLDEPLAGLDAAAVQALCERLRTHLAGGGMAVLSCHTDTWTRTDLPLQHLRWA